MVAAYFNKVKEGSYTVDPKKELAKIESKIKADLEINKSFGPN